MQYWWPLSGQTVEWLLYRYQRPGQRAQRDDWQTEWGYWTCSYPEMTQVGVVFAAAAAVVAPAELAVAVVAAVVVAVAAAAAAVASWTLWLWKR